MSDHTAAEKVGNLLLHETERLKPGFKQHKDYGPIDGNFYKSACSYIKEHLDAAEEDFLPAGLLMENLRAMFWKSGTVKMRMPERPADAASASKPTNKDDRFIYTLAVFPTSDMNTFLDEKEIGAHEYFYMLTTNPRTGITANYSVNEAKYLGLLPDHIRENCSFTLEYETDNSMITFDDLRRIYAKYIKAFNNLREFFELEPVAPETVIGVFREEGIELGDDLMSLA